MCFENIGRRREARSLQGNNPNPRNVRFLNHALERGCVSSILACCRLKAGLQTAVLQSILFLFSAWLTTGCVPIRFTTSPGATGRIVDASTHAPISGAEIVISRSTYPPESPEKAFVNNRPPMVMSREAGQFSVPLERRLDFYFLPIDVFPRFGLVVIRCQGYETTCVPFWSRSVADLGEIDVSRR
jgi:hypothetical protein